MLNFKIKRTKNTKLQDKEIKIYKTTTECRWNKKFKELKKCSYSKCKKLEKWNLLKSKKISCLILGLINV